MTSKNLTEQHLLEIYDFIFSSTHSIEFKTTEIRSLLFDKEYWFIEKPKENWKNSLMDYLDSIGYEKLLLDINEKL